MLHILSAGRNFVLPKERHVCVATEDPKEQHVRFAWHVHLQKVCRSQHPKSRRPSSPPMYLNLWSCVWFYCTPW